MTVIPNRILEQFMICAFRYALERRTTILIEILEYIEPYWSCLNAEFQRQIKDDIRRKIQYIDKDDLAICKIILELPINEQRYPQLPASKESTEAS